MKPRERFLKALNGETTDVPAVGSPTSLATVDLMAATGCFFPDVHNDAEKMATLAATGYEVLGYDAIAPECAVPVTMDSRPLRRIVEAARGLQVRQ